MEEKTRKRVGDCTYEKDEETDLSQRENEKSGVVQRESLVLMRVRMNIEGSL